jgi:hypothetical protein
MNRERYVDAEMKRDTWYEYWYSPTVNFDLTCVYPGSTPISEYLQLLDDFGETLALDLDLRSWGYGVGTIIATTIVASCLMGVEQDSKGRRTVTLGVLAALSLAQGILCILSMVSILNTKTIVNTALLKVDSLLPVNKCVDEENQVDLAQVE